MVMLIMIVIGLAFMLLGWAMWYARRNEAWRKWIEKVFLDPGEGLFDQDKSYTPYVRWMRYAAFVTGLVFLIPTPLLIDLVAGAIGAALFFFWVNRGIEKQKPATAG